MHAFTINPYPLFRARARARARNRILFSLVFLLLLFSSLAAVPPPAGLPPGVSVSDSTPAQALPLGYAAQYVDIDWNESLLSASLVDYAANPLSPPPDMLRLEQTQPEPLRIQLVEPARPTEPGGGGALPIYVAPAVNADSTSPSSFPNLPFFTLLSPNGWLPGGAAEGAIPGEVSPPSIAGSRAAVRWLGRSAALDTLPLLDFNGFCLLSITRLEKNQTRFILVHRTATGVGRLGELRRWLRAMAAAEDWIAVHSIGPHAFAAFRGWRLTADPDPRTPQRAGGVLELTPLGEGDPIDWLCRPGFKLDSSEFDPNHPPHFLAGASLIPQILSPRGWISQPMEPRADPPWLSITFTNPRPVDRIEIYWAEAAGWSRHYNPARATLQIAGATDSQPRNAAAFEFPETPVAVWRASRTTDIRAIRLVFDDPSVLPGDNRARLAAIRVVGPWDGQSR